MSHSDPDPDRDRDRDRDPDPDRDPSKTRILIGIDVGYSNLGLAVASVDCETWSIQTVFVLQRFELYPCIHQRVSQEHCTLFHSKNASDLVDHIVQEIQPWAEEAFEILIERQPLGGMVHIEQLLFRHYRSKAVLCSPNSMHKMFDMSADYETRKQQSLDLARSYVLHHTEFQQETRQHDMADAILLILFRLRQWKTQQQIKAVTRSVTKALPPPRVIADSTESFFERFRHRPLVKQ